MYRNEPSSNPDQVEKEAARAAEAHEAAHGPGEPDWLANTLKAREDTLKRAYQYFLRLSEQEFTQSYAAEWLLDNFHIIEEALREIRKDIPPAYYAQLPKLAAPPYKGKPRVYAIAVEMMSSSQGLLQIGEVLHFIESYQKTRVLEIGELWALPVMYRVVILGSVAQAVTRVMGLSQTGSISETGAVIPIPTASAPDETIIANGILSLRELAALDWKEIFENLSHVEQVLRADPSGTYGSMDFDTRDRYRKEVERLALATGESETDVARLAIGLAEEKSRRHKGGDPRERHVGYYLIGPGCLQLEARLGYAPPRKERALRWLRDRPTLLYLGSIGGTALLIFVALARYVFNDDTGPMSLSLIMPLIVVSVLVCATGLMNWVFTHVLPPRVLAKLDFSKGVAPDCRTMVVVPALLTDQDEVAALLRQIELHFLGNEDPYLSFALLTDFTDASQRVTEADQALVDEAVAGIERLNARYARPDAAGPPGPFYLFHRERQWNETEGVWMGWERKRGKIEEFNRLLAGNEATSFIVLAGDLTILPDVRYVITLDADTILPRGEAFRLIGTLAHPLNRARLDERTGEITGGYTLLQPRIQIRPPGAGRSRFMRLFAGDTGFDLYSRAISDIYQDLFGEGIYVGKGIYDVAAFERGLAGRVPQNALLSHDLFEGLHVGVALATDLTLVEEYPPTYIAYARRLHRWMRGDWQLLPWLFTRLPYPDRCTRPHRLSLISCWKILDNLFRSLFSPALLVLLILAWLGLLGPALPWTIFVFLASATPLLTGAASELSGLLNGRTIKGVASSVWQSAARWLLLVTFMPYEAIMAVDAIVSTLFRLIITRRHLLKWTTAAHTARLLSMRDSSIAVWREMGGAALVSAAIALLVLAFNPSLLLPCAPLLCLWFFSPEISYRIGLPLKRVREVLPMGQRYQLRRLARRTWFYFEQFVGPDDQWLPPDHFQESPRGLPARRTSPTNVGLMLLSAMAAHDLGYIGALALANRLQSTFETMERLERYRGHFLNWYDTRAASPLPPRYVSTVDSGNLAACLITLKQGFLSLRHAPLIRWQYLQGLLDTLDIMDEVVEQLKESAPIAVNSLQAYWDRIRGKVLAVKDDPAAWGPLLGHLEKEERPELDRHLMAFIEAGGRAVEAPSLSAVRLWVERIHYQLHTAEREMATLAPWLKMLERAPVVISGSEEPLISDTWNLLNHALPPTPLLDEVEQACEEAYAFLNRLRSLLPGLVADEDDLGEALMWAVDLGDALVAAEVNARNLLKIYDELGRQSDRFVEEMDFGFLLDRQRQLFHIGYNVDAGKLDSNYYDLLASEARIASLIAIAKGDVPQSHWLHLNRPLALMDGDGVGLLSWSGSMFEYLMPTLFMHEDDDSLLGRVDMAAVERQIAYGKKKGVPWGISESAYYQFDPHMNYQYRAFGVPGLGFKRGAEDDLVITPYASMLALPYRPKAVMENVASLVRTGMLGNFGLYESIDYTEARLAMGKKHAIVRSFYAHHQGMIFLSMANYLLEGTIVRHFHCDPRIQSVELLLQEQVPEKAFVDHHMQDEAASGPVARAKVALTPWSVPVQTHVPRVHFLSNGDYGVLITNGGAGYSRWKEIALTRWRADSTLDNWGSWIYVHEPETGDLWSAGYQPADGTTQLRKVSFAPDKVDFQCQTQDIVLHLEITVAPHEPVEIRRLSVTNVSARTRRLTISSYGEIVLAARDVDKAHQAFNKLFIESEYLPEMNALLFHRRIRSASEDPVWLIHGFVAANGYKGPVMWETDRSRFLGRQRTCADPMIFGTQRHGFSGTVGATLDPVMALACELELPENGTVHLAYFTLAASTRREALRLAELYRRWPAIERAFGQIRSQSEQELSRLELATRDLQLIQELLSVLLYPHAALRADPQILASNSRGQKDLWRFSVSGDYPVLLLCIGREEELALVKELLRAHTYWRDRGLKIDLVILNTRETGYVQEVQGQLLRLLARTNSDAWLNRRGGIFIVRGDQIDEAELVLLKTVARAILDGEKGSLAEQMKNLQREPASLPAFVPGRSASEETEPTPPLTRPTDLAWDNGLGGFSPGGEEYVIYLEPGQATPAPWINVIANPFFGFLVSEGGLGCTWAINSGENRLTPWHNDPLIDTPAEALYLRDEETAQIWSPTPLPSPGNAPYLVRHGMGYSQFEHHSHGLAQKVCLFAALDDPVKCVQVRLENLWSRPRRVTLTYYVEWLLGNDRERMQQFVVSEFDELGQALLARNAYNTEFHERVAFVCSDTELHGLTACRTEFMGSMGNPARPAALTRIGLANRTEAGIDPCAALQVHIDLEPGEAKETCFIMGEGADRGDALRLANLYRQPGNGENTRQKITLFWESLLSAVRVETPDPAMDGMLNRWLLYQTLTCRLWGRTALYQSSGAYGFRDQLQDVMALVHVGPELARAHILMAAGRQFEEGDVLHWWHPPSVRGVRTRISDDLLWLPFVTAHYVKSTGDRSILAEKMPFLRDKPLDPDEEERYGYYETTPEGYSLFEHCRRAIRKGSTSGMHGIPLIGAGDWNDGMNRVGVKGLGESIWLGWFLYAVMNEFAGICDMEGENTQAAAYREHADIIKQNLESTAWDGEWYLRAYYDYGVPLGSGRSRECQIDSIAQSWAVISGAGGKSRTEKAMESVMERLVNPEAQLVQLFAPPFDKTPHDPGYIKGYPPGIRENGGQYTHAALWSVWAYALLGQGERAVDLFRMLNPITHGDTEEKIALYRGEPYVVAADVYSTAPHTGRAGWTWYTGAAGWMYRVGLEAILGICRRGDTLLISPCIPKDWPGYRVTYRFGRSLYHIQVANPHGLNRGFTEITCDGHILNEQGMPLSDDGLTHEVTAVIRAEAPTGR
ncbi:MAG TPA: glucoamylase family protein [Syntrophorhabdaceae bacterium]